VLVFEQMTHDGTLDWMTSWWYISWISAWTLFLLCRDFRKDSNFVLAASRDSLKLVCNSWVACVVSSVWNTRRKTVISEVFGIGSSQWLCQLEITPSTKILQRMESF